MGEEEAEGGEVVDNDITAPINVKAKNSLDRLNNQMCEYLHNPNSLIP